MLYMTNYTQNFQKNTIFLSNCQNYCEIFFMSCALDSQPPRFLNFNFYKNSKYYNVLTHNIDSSTQQ